MDVLYVPINGDARIAKVRGLRGIYRLIGHDKAEAVGITKDLQACMSSMAWYMSVANRKLRPFRVFGDAIIMRYDGTSISQEDIKTVQALMPGLVVGRAYESRADQRQRGCADDHSGAQS